MYILYGTALNLAIENILAKNKPLSVTEICEKLMLDHDCQNEQQYNLQRRVRRALKDMEHYDIIEKKMVKNSNAWFQVPVYSLK